MVRLVSIWVLGLLAVAASGISVSSTNEGVFVNGQKVASGCCHNVNSINGDVYVDGRKVGHFEDHFGRKKRSTNYNVNNNGYGSTNNNNNNNGGGNNYNINNNDGGYNVNNNNNDGEGTNVNVNNNGGGYNVNNNYNGNPDGQSYNINNNNNGGGGYSINNNGPAGGLSVSGPGAFGNGPNGQPAALGQSGQMPSQTPTDPLHGMPPNDPYNGMWPNDPYNGMNNDPYNGLWPNDPYNLNKGGPNQAYPNAPHVPFQRQTNQPFSPVLGHKPFSREASRDPFSALQDPQPRRRHGFGGPLSDGSQISPLSRTKRETRQRRGNRGHLSGLSGNQGNVGNTNARFGNNPTSPNDGQATGNHTETGMENNNHWCDPDRLHYACVISNGYVCACRVSRKMTAEDHQMLQSYKQAMKQWKLDAFPPGFPFKRPTVQPKFPEFPPICKCPTHKPSSANL